MMEEGDNLKPGKRPRVGDSADDVRKALAEKEREYCELQRNFMLLAEEHKIMQKKFSNLLDKLEANSTDCTSEEDMAVGDSEVVTKTKKQKKFERKSQNFKNQAKQVAGKIAQKKAVIAGQDKAVVGNDVGTSRSQGHTVDDLPRSSQTQVESTAGGKKSIPIITAYNINVKKIGNLIDKALGHSNFNMKLMGKNATNIGVCTIENFERLKVLLKDEGVSYYTYTPKAMRPFSLVVEGLSSTYSVEDVMDYLGGLKIRLNILSLVILGGDKWLLRLARDSDISAFYGVQYILRCRVRMRKFRRGAVTQCFNCQRFGHVSSNCAMPYRCVKCGASHGPGKCNIPSKVDNTAETLVTDPVTGQAIRRVGLPVKCINCGVEGHVASSRECPRRLELLKKIEAKKTSQAKPVGRNYFANTGLRSGVSYAAAAAASTPKPTSAPSSSTGLSLKGATEEFECIDKDCRRFFGGGLLSCLGKIGGFAREYRGLKDDESKSRALLGMLISLQQDG